MSEHRTQILSFLCRNTEQAKALAGALREHFSGSSHPLAFEVLPTDIVVGFTAATYSQTIENQEDAALEFSWGFVAGWQEGKSP